MSRPEGAVRQGWGEDPFGRHEQRYFSAGRPTRLVRDGNAESYDGPPAGACEPPGAGTEAPRPADIAGSAPGSGPAGPPRASRARLFTVAALVVAAVLILMTAIGRAASTRTPAPSAAAFVVRAAQRTLAERTAEITLAETIQAEGQSIPVTMAGAVDVGTGATDMSVAYDYPGRPVAMKEIVVGGNAYIAMTVDGTSVVTAGRHWLVTPLHQGPAYGDPFSSLSVLRQPGNGVRKLGTKSVGGVRCAGYAVTVSKHAMAAATGFFLPDGTAPPAYTVWADATGLIRAFSTDMRWSALASPPGTTTSAVLTVTVQRYGAPVRITAPAASDTYSSGASGGPPGR